ncbi:hypothetical protein PUR59_00960 [Streptomyces sp. SP18ES09]|uniref:hypothetical protein n=1 Tax=Streptomyces sp. SP18ES09 TaxID=3002532 RepID=UPI002E773F8A|nr:hypothetical protein [Streptomyces sp. SP18ES09]MEE1813611.1 hypothetical protein [Streptomyces sp. SP18ES09]
MRIFGREPALILGFLAAALKLLAAFGLDVSATQQTLINAVLAAVVGVWIAIVARDGALGAAIMQLAQAALALFVGFGLDWSAEKQGLVMAAIAALLALWERTQVTAPVSLTRLEQTSPVKAAGPTGV